MQEVGCMANRLYTPMSFSLTHLYSLKRANVLLDFVARFASKTETVRKLRFQGTMSAASAHQEYDYFLVLDFEATCERNKQIKPQEIIEFPCLKVNSGTFLTESIFHQYVQPRIHNQLSTFCTELTGIIQGMVDTQPFLEGTMQSFDRWMRAEHLLDDAGKAIFVTCGDWDLNIMLPNQCQYFNIMRPEYMKTWVNIKRSFSEATGIWPKGIVEMLRYFKIPHEGRLHSGIDDCKNIVEILKALAEQKGYIFQPNGVCP